MNEEKIKERKINKKSHITHHTSNNKGITLVALIITIIVLLILAVVAIRAVQGDGIISQAKNARDEYEKAQTNEQTTLEGALGEIESNIPNKSGPQVIIGGEKVTLTETNVKAYLGKKVTNYIGQTTVTIGDKTYTVSPEYRLYYVDFANKYNDGAGTIYLKAECTSNNYELPVTDTSSADAENIKIKNLNPSLYATGVTSPAASNNNMKAVTWLTNTTNWSSLADTSMSSNINYIVGSPSLEMMMDSYNTHYNLTGDTPDYKAITAGERRKLFYRYQTNSSGYQVGPCATNRAEYGTFTSYNSVYTDSAIDSMYYPGSSKFYWLASPSADYSNRVMFVYFDFGGDVHNSSCTSSNALCPLVSLKSSVQLELAN